MFTNDYREFNEIYHHGVKGQKWGVRRYQNEDGSLTPLGKRRLGKLIESKAEYDKALNERLKAAEAERKYVTKSGYYKYRRGDVYKESVRDLYLDDENFRPISDKYDESLKHVVEVGKKYWSEYRKAMSLHNGPIYQLGRENVDFILKNYDEYKKNQNGSNERR